MPNWNKDDERNKILRKYGITLPGQDQPDAARDIKKLPSRLPDKPADLLETTVALPKVSPHKSDARFIDDITEGVTRFPKIAQPWERYNKLRNEGNRLFESMDAVSGASIYWERQEVEIYAGDDCLMYFGFGRQLSRKILDFLYPFPPARKKAAEVFGGKAAIAFKELNKIHEKTLPRWQRTETCSEAYKVTDLIHNSNEQVPIFSVFFEYLKLLRNRPSNTLKPTETDAIFFNFAEIIRMETITKKMRGEAVLTADDFYSFIRTCLIASTSDHATKMRKEYPPFLSFLLREGMDFINETSVFLRDLLEALKDLDHPAHMSARDLVSAMTQHPGNNESPIATQLSFAILTRYKSEKSISVIEFFRALQQNSEETGDDWYAELGESCKEDILKEGLLHLFSTQDWIDKVATGQFDQSFLTDSRSFQDLTTTAQQLSHSTLRTEVSSDQDIYLHSFSPNSPFSIEPSIFWKEKIIYFDYYVSSPPGSLYRGEFLIDFSQEEPQAILHVVDDEPVPTEMNDTLVALAYRVLQINIEELQQQRIADREKKVKPTTMIEMPEPTKRKSIEVYQAPKPEPEQKKRKHQKGNTPSSASTQKTEEDRFISEIVLRRNFPILHMTKDVKDEVKQEYHSAPKILHQVLSKIDAYNKAIHAKQGAIGEIKRLEYFSGPHGRSIWQLKNGEHRIWAEEDSEDPANAHVFLIFRKKDYEKIVARYRVKH